MNEESQNNSEANRKEFLLHMYNQMFNDINQHMGVVWQPITVLVGSFALIAAATSDIISMDIAAALIIVLAGWLIAILYDSSYWYNRNLVIIANIERQFLSRSDLTEIHYYFGKHRKPGSMMDHIRIQWYLGVFVGGLILLYHLFTEVLKRWPTTWKFNQLEQALPFTLPWIATIAVVVSIILLRKHYITSYNEFIKNSPGIEVDTEGIDYGVGHPTDNKPQEQK